MLLKAKDYFTLGNALGGFFAVIFVIRGEMEMASYSIIVALAFDLSDGFVARLTKQFNQFGSELDNVADLISFSVGPSFIIYGFYTQHPHFPALPWWLAAMVASMPLLAGVVRFARFNVKKLHYEGVWFGFPRPAAAFLYLGYINSHMGQTSEVMYYLGILVVAYVSMAHFILLPYMNHHRKDHPTFLKWTYWFVFSSMALASIGHFVTGVSLVWDVITYWLFCYLFLTPFLGFGPKERAKLKIVIDEWKQNE